jgi:hypothetical protein
MLVSKYGFMNILENGRVVLDPSRVAAQVVSGIGFIGDGIIFMRRDVARHQPIEQMADGGQAQLDRRHRMRRLQILDPGRNVDW